MYRRAKVFTVTETPFSPGDQIFSPYDAICTYMYLCTFPYGASGITGLRAPRKNHGTGGTTPLVPIAIGNVGRADVTSSMLESPCSSAAMAPSSASVGRDLARISSRGVQVSRDARYCRQVTIAMSWIRRGGTGPTGGLRTWRRTCEAPHSDGVRSPSRYVSFCMPSRGNRLTSPLLASYSSAVNRTRIPLRRVFRWIGRRHHVGTARVFVHREYTRDSLSRVGRIAGNERESSQKDRANLAVSPTRSRSPSCFASALVSWLGFRPTSARSTARNRAISFRAANSDVEASYTVSLRSEHIVPSPVSSVPRAGIRARGGRAVR